MASDLAVAAKPLATAHSPLSAALATPSADAAQLDLLRQTLASSAAAKRPGLYEPCPANGTSPAILRTARDEQVGQVSATVRLARDLPISGPILLSLLPQAGAPSAGVSGGPGPLQPDGKSAAGAGEVTADAGAAAPLPSSHWACALAAEEVGLWGVLSKLGAAVAGAAGALTGRLAVEPRELDTCQQAMLQATGAGRACGLCCADLCCRCLVRRGRRPVTRWRGGAAPLAQTRCR